MISSLLAYVSLSSGNLTNGATVNVPVATALTISLQNTIGIRQGTITIGSDYETLNGYTFPYSPGHPSQFTLELPLTPCYITATSVMSDGNNTSTSQNTFFVTQTSAVAAPPGLFAALATTPAPASGHGFVVLDGYTVQGDAGNGKIAIWVATSTATPVNYSIAQVTGTTVGRWIVVSDTINVKDFGAKGDGATDDYAALASAITAWTALMDSTSGGGPGIGSLKLKFPGGTYYCSQALVVQGVKGGVIEGDGLYTTLIAMTTALHGAAACFELRDCEYVTVRDLGINPNIARTTLTSSPIAGATSFTVASATNISVGQRIALSGATSEEVHVASVSGSTLGIGGPGLLYGYSSGTIVLTGAAAVIACTTYQQTSGGASHGNIFERLLLNSANTTGDVFYGFGTYCLGGGPVFLRTAASSGATSVTVWDATQMYVGQTIQIWDGIAGATEAVKTLTAVNPATGVITFASQPLGFNHSVGPPNLCFVASASDANNDEHVVNSCYMISNYVAGVGLVGLNTLNHSFDKCEMTSSYALLSARQGGSIKWARGDATASYVDFEIGGPQSRATSTSHQATESTSRTLVVHAQDNTEGLQVWFDHYDKKGQPGSFVNVVDVTAYLSKIEFHGCNWFFSASGFGLSLVDLSGSGDVVFSGKCQIGMSTVTLNGVLMIDYDSFWSTISAYNPPTETLSNGASIETYSACYNSHSSGNGGPVKRSPVRALTLTNGNNDGVIAFGSSDLVATGPTSAYSLHGFVYGAAGQRLRIQFKINQALTIANNSSTAIPILTGTGADAVFSAPGGFLIIDFWCDGTNWNVVVVP
jgi:hypothetical protein